MRNMAKPSYSAYALKPEEAVVCIALDSENYPQLYTERVKSVLGTIRDEGLRERVRQTLGSFVEREAIEDNGSVRRVLAQSSPYRLVVLQDILPKEKVLAARPRLQLAKENDYNFLSGFYVDFGLNLVSGEEGYQDNSIQAAGIAADLLNVGMELTNPKLIPYSVLTHTIDGNSSSGLVFKLSEQGEDNAKSLIQNTRDFNWDYSPTRNGLFRVYLYKGGSWDANVDNLQNSDDDGRVVVETTGEASAKNFKELQEQSVNLFDRQRKERDDLIARLRA